MKNKLSDLNNHLFAQLERLNDEDLTGDELMEEIERAKAVKNISMQIVENASLQLRAVELQCEYGMKDIGMPTMLESKEGVS